MKSEKLESRKAKRNHRTFTAEEKCRAVLSVWTERRKSSEVCRELQVAWMQFCKWQDLALQGILGALETKKDQIKCPPLGGRLAKLLERKVSAPPGRKPESSLERRLGKLLPEKPAEKAV